MRPVIGIPPRLRDRTQNPSRPDALQLDLAYAEAVEAGGGVPLCLPRQSDAGALVQLIDGLLLPGGGDFLPPEPSRYPEGVVFHAVSPRQLEFDRRLLTEVLARGLPVLGICYGMQLLALHSGGELHHHIPVDQPGAFPHQLAEDRRHPIEVEAGSRLASLIGTSPHPVNSRHHQAVKAAGPGFRVCARSPDGVVEAIEADGDDFSIGVQWHPETLEGPAGSGLVGALLAAARRQRRTT